MAGKTSVDLSLPKARKVRGYTIERMPIGRFLAATRRLDEVPGQVLRRLFPGAEDAVRALASLDRAGPVSYTHLEARPRVAQLDARSAFVVYDDTVEHAPLLGITRRDTFDARLERTGEEVTLYTDRLIVHMRRTSRETPRETMREAHYFGGVPVVEYWNNAREEGDFEPVMGLIDAYDTLQSDRVNDKQQFTDAVLDVYKRQGRGQGRPLWGVGAAGEMSGNSSGYLRSGP